MTLSRNPSATGTWIKTSNTKEDFSVNCVATSAVFPYFTAGTPFNCVVTNYDSSNGILTFNATPDITGAFKFGIIVRSGQGTGMISSTTLETTTPFSSITISRTFTYSYTGLIYANIAKSLSITVSPLTALTGGTANIKVYYSTSNIDNNPILCSSSSGTAVNASGQSTVSCTFLTGGTFYLYIGLSVDLYNLSSPAVSTLVVLTNANALILSATKTYNWLGTAVPDYDVYLPVSQARALWDLTLGYGCSTYGFIGAFRNGADPNLIYANTQIPWIVSESNTPSNNTKSPSSYGNESIAPTQNINDGRAPSPYCFSYIRWGYTILVRPNKLWVMADLNANYNSGNQIELWGYQSNSFSGGDLLFSGTFPGGSLTRGSYSGVNGVNLAFNQSAIVSNTTGWKYFEIKNVGNSGWSTQCQFLLRY